MGEWISVEDRLPEDDWPVIAHTADYVPTMTVVPARYNEKLETWFDLDNLDMDGEELPMHQVTHWMPFPPPPEAT